MHARPDPTAPRGLLASLLAAVASVPLSLILAAVGQGIGSIIGGGGWIGLCVPWERPVWALVNQPVLNFAALPRASGYWLGSTIAPMLAAVVLMPLSLRLRTLTGQLMAVQFAWTSSVIGVLWQAGLDPEHAHLTRWLEFRGLPAGLRFVPAALVGVAVVPVALRLLATARITRQLLRRRHRLGLVLVHLVPVPLAWAMLSTVLRGRLAVEAAVVVMVPLAVVVAVAWTGYPALLTHRVAPVQTSGVLRLLLVLAVAWAALWLAGRPLAAGQRAAAVQWAMAGSFNNVRPWMEPALAPWLEHETTLSAPPG